MSLRLSDQPDFVHRAPRRPVPGPVAIDPRLYEHEFAVWLHSPSVPIGEFYGVLERREWLSHRPKAHEPLIRLNPPELAAIKRQLVERIAAAGGEYRTGAVVLRSDGKTLSVTMVF